MNPSRKPSWRVVTQRLARAIAALPSPPPDGTTWSRSSSSRRADQRGERRDVGVDPAGPIDDRRALDDPRQLGPQGLRQARARSGPSPRRSRPPLRGSSAGGEGARRRTQPFGRDPLRPGPVDEAAPRDALSAPAEDRRGRAERGPDEEPRLPEPVVAPDRPAATPTPPSRARPPVSSTRLHVDERVAEEPAGDRAGSRRRPRRELDVARRAPVARVGASSPLISSSSASADAVAVAESTIATPSPATARDDRPEQRVVGAAEQQRVDPRRTPAAETRTRRPQSRSPEQRRQAVGDGGLDLGAGQLAGLDQRHERRRRVLVHLDGRVLVLDRAEVGVRADGGRAWRSRRPAGCAS